MSQHVWPILPWMCPCLGLGLLPPGHQSDNHTNLAWHSLVMVSFVFVSTPCFKCPMLDWKSEHVGSGHKGALVKVHLWWYAPSQFPIKKGRTIWLAEFQHWISQNSYEKRLWPKKQNALCQIVLMNSCFTWEWSFRGITTLHPHYLQLFLLWGEMTSPWLPDGHLWGFKQNKHTYMQTEQRPNAYT